MMSCLMPLLAQAALLLKISAKCRSHKFFSHPSHPWRWRGRPLVESPLTSVESWGVVRSLFAIVTVTVVLEISVS